MLGAGNITKICIWRGDFGLSGSDHLYQERGASFALLRAVLEGMLLERYDIAPTIAKQPMACPMHINDRSI
eukprot:6180908-Amphidinium_carterae.2